MSTVGTVIRMKTRLLQWLDRKADARIERVTGQPAGKHRAPRDMAPPPASQTTNDYPQMVGRGMRPLASLDALIQRDQAALGFDTEQKLAEILGHTMPQSGIEADSYRRAIEIPAGPGRILFAFNYLSHAVRCNTQAEAQAVARGLKRALEVR